MKRNTRLAAILMVSVLLMGFACQNKAAVASRDIATAVKAFQTAEISLHQQKDAAGILKISDAEHLVIQKYIKAVAISGKAANNCIRASSGPACADQGIQAAQDLLNHGLAGIKNEQSKQQLQIIAQSILLAWNNFKVLL